MKKKIILIALLVFLITPVTAKENKLYFTEKDERIYYESKLIDEDMFMKHTEMVPGEKYKDELKIENGTNTKYTLYFKVVPREQSEEADELLENIEMKITLDGEEIYEGKATGLDYTDEGVDLQEAILVGEFSPSKTAKMEVETKLSEEYDNTENEEFSYIDWSFYAQYDISKPPVQIVEAPNTMKNSFPYTIVISIAAVVLGLGIICYAKKKEN